MRKVFVASLLLALCWASTAWAGGGQEAAAGAGGTIVLYTSVPQPIIDKIQADFNGKFPEITLEVFRSGTSAVVAKIATEKEAGGIAADLVWVAEPSTYENFKDQGLLLQFKPPEAKNLPKEMKDPDGYYYAGRLINMIIGYNKSVSSPPQSWKDLPSYGGKKGFPTPLRSGAAVAAAQTLVDAYGWEYFETFQASGGVQVQNNSAARDLLATGELQVSALLDYIVRGAMEQGSPIDYVWPKDGAVFIPSPIAIFKDSRNPESAIAFVDYILSVEGQRTMVELGSFIPVRPDVQPPPNTPSLNKVKAMKTDWKSVQKGQEALVDRWTTIFGE